MLQIVGLARWRQGKDALNDTRNRGEADLPIEERLNRHLVGRVQRRRSQPSHSEGLARQREWNRMEAKGLEYHRRVREGFLAQARRHPERIHVLDATRPIDAVHADIIRVVTTGLSHLNETGRRGDP